MQKEDKGDSAPFQASGKNPTSFLRDSYPKLHYSLILLIFKIWEKRESQGAREAMLNLYGHCYRLSSLSQANNFTSMPQFPHP